ncbi:uncharacterized protein PV07_03182 [Cladophialophora immunda]|uniref:Uncharacterized protein n=1 Tax=Cladophialophora immunda TaxID=569365 RepID=A0A0D2B1Q7_9EURO|nr:uncharacterized protein PV07_03182 [Cladophialophora immunda]KIW31542.1 hypothetical protein PV07_03182 [Cladophialophora immunda]OQV04278.1 hypothetical protein CLAIMM_09188 [Cladophialophora immunda]
MESHQGYVTLSQEGPPRLELQQTEGPLFDLPDNNGPKISFSENEAERDSVKEGNSKRTPLDSYSLLKNTGRETHKVSNAWRAGNKARIPLLSLCCLLIMFAILAAMIVILLVSDGQDVESWGAATMNIGGHSHYWQVSVSAWLALANFLLSKTLAVMFAEAVAVSWWVDAIRGQTLKRLHFRWAVGNSIQTVALHWRLWGWICVGSLAFTIFAGLEVVLQQASSSTTVLSLIPRNMTSELASALPAGFSGVVAAVAHDTFGVVYFTPPFIQVLQDYKIQSPVSLDLKGCDSTSNVSCTTRLPGVGFQYTCNATRSALLDPLSTDPSGSALQPPNSVFQVNVTTGIDWEIGLSVLWQDERGYQGKTVTNRHCTLLPALVEYPVNVTQGVATLQAPTSQVEWTTSPSNPDDEALLVDKVLNLLPIPEHDKTLYRVWIEESDPNSGQHSTLGGVALAFSSLFGSSIVLKSDVTNFGSDVAVTGSFAAPYAVFEHGTGDIDAALNNTYASPMNALLSNIRDIMFRTTVAIATQRVGDYMFPNSSALDVQTATVPAHNVTAQGEYRVYHTVYKTNRTVLGVAVALMLVAILAILPLYDGYWLLGRKVSLSPFEVAKALHYSTVVIDKRTGERQPYSVLDVVAGPDRVPQSGSNLSADELVKVLGARKVRYGEVGPNILGVGLIEYTEPPKAGRLYD